MTGRAGCILPGEMSASPKPMYLGYDSLSQPARLGACDSFLIELICVIPMPCVGCQFDSRLEKCRPPEVLLSQPRNLCQLCQRRRPAEDQRVGFATIQMWKEEQCR